jgi:ankyrin repeat protein
MRLAKTNSYDWSGLITVALVALPLFSCQVQKESEGGVSMVDLNKMFTDKDLLAAARAIESGDLPKLNFLLQNGTPVNGRGNDGATLLMLAVGTKKKEATRDLLRSGADPNQLSDKGLSAVMLAAGSDDPDLLPILVDGGADPNLRNDRHEPVTFTAGRNKRWQNLNLLLDRGADMNATDPAGDTLMVSLAFQDQYEPIVNLLERGADFRKVGEGGWTLAHSIQECRLRPDSREGQWLQKAKSILEARGVKFPVPLPGK